MSRIETPDKLLFTPGPLTTSRRVKEAMLRDFGSRDAAFIDVVRGVRRRLLALAGVSQEAGFEAVLMQGSGTFGLEAVVTSAVPHTGRLLVAVNGAYGERVLRIARAAGVRATELRFAEDVPVDPGAVGRALADDPTVTAVSIVHCETTTGLMNPVEAVGRVVRAAGCAYFVDAMSSFGAVPLALDAAGVDFLVTSANKCLEGVPGFAVVLARRAALEAAAGQARSLSLDLHAQWRGLEADGQFRFTPPTHAILALEEALRELGEEGGVAGRAARYRANHEALVAGMRRLGFRPYLPPVHQGYVITSFHYPDDPRFAFDVFYAKLNARGFVIYPGKLSRANCFRIGNIGRIFPDDVRRLVAAIGEVAGEMGVSVSAAPSTSETHV